MSAHQIKTCTQLFFIDYKQWITLVIVWTKAQFLLVNFVLFTIISTFARLGFTPQAPRGGNESPTVVDLGK